MQLSIRQQFVKKHIFPIFHVMVKYVCVHADSSVSVEQRFLSAHFMKNIFS